MKKITLTAIFALFMVWSVSAQDNKVGFGLKAGLNTAMEWASEGTTDSRIGLHAGFFVEIPVARIVDIQPELLYSMQGGASDGLTEKLDYINLPIMVKIYVNQKRSFSIDVGPQIGYLVSAKVESSNLYDFYNKVDVAICFGASYKITGHFYANLRFTLGVMKIIDGAENCNGVGQLGISYRF